MRRWIRYTAAFIGLAAALISFAPLAYAQEKVAVLVSTPDVEGTLDDSFQDLEKQAIEAYTSMGFRVIMVGGANTKHSEFSPDTLKKKLGELQNVKDLRLDFIGHGSLTTIDGDLYKRGPGLKMSEQRIDATDQLRNKRETDKILWLAANTTSADSKYYGSKAAMLSGTPNDYKHIDHQSVQEAVEKFSDNNPKAVTTVNSLNCFSGALAQTFRLDPNVIVYANSPINEPALDISSWVERESNSGFIRSTNALSQYYDALKSKKSESVSFDKARGFANGAFLKAIEQAPEAIYTMGRSPIFESVMGWCEAGYPGAVEGTKEPYPMTSPRAEIQGRLVNEIRDQKRTFDRALKVPAYDDENKTLAETAKDTFLECLENQKKRVPTYRDGEAKEIAFRDLFRKNPTLPLQLYFKKLESALADTKRRSAIAGRLAASVERDLGNLSRAQVPEDRQGGIKVLSDRIKRKEISVDDVIVRMKTYVQKAKLDCSTGLPHDPACDVHRARIVEISEIVFNHGAFPNNPDKPSYPPENVCPLNAKYFTCLFSQPENGIHWMSELERHAWAKVSEFDHEETCVGDWQRIQSVRRNLELDSACMNKFNHEAPEAEWVNLERLFRLGARNARTGKEVFGVPAAHPIAPSGPFPAGGSQ